MNNDSSSGKKGIPIIKPKLKAMLTSVFQIHWKPTTQIILDIGRTYINEQFKCGA